jgi:hypothetical protein
MDPAGHPFIVMSQVRSIRVINHGSLTMHASAPVTLVVSMIAFAAIPATLPAQSISTRVDSARREVVIEAGPFDVPAMDLEMVKEMEHASMRHEEERRVFRFDWPVEGPARAYRVEVRDSADHPLPRSLLHHVIAINFDRREFIYQQAERLFGIGRETPDISLPGTLMVPLRRGERLGFYVAWHNDTGRDLQGATVRVVVAWIPGEVAKSYTAVLPVYFDVDNEVGATNTFDLPPGKSSKSFEFVATASGYLIGVTGHLHDYGKSVRLEDAETGKVMVRLTATRDSTGRILEIPRKFFLLRPLRMREGHRYRIVAEYESPRRETIVDGAMANILGVFAPDSHSRWPAIDPNNPTFMKDIASLPIVVPQSGTIERVTYSQRPHQ